MPSARSKCVCALNFNEKTIDFSGDGIMVRLRVQVYFLGEKMKAKKKVLKSLTELETVMLFEKRKIVRERGWPLRF